MLMVPSHAYAHSPQSFEHLALRLNLDDRVQIEDQSGVKVAGRLSQLTRDEIVIETPAGDKRFTRDTVRAVAVRGHALRKGAVIGAGVVAVLGAVATCSNEGGPGCVFIGLFGGAPIGAGLGLAIGALIPQMKPVYRAPADRVSTQPPGAGGVQASLLEDLALRVNLNDRLRVEDRSGGTTTGGLMRLTADDITIETDTGEKHFTRETVRQIAVRYRPLRVAVLIGAGAGAAAGAVAACTGEEREECVDGAIMAGALGAGLGLAAGALIHTTKVVFPEQEQRTSVAPLISRGAVGVLVSRRW